MPKLDEAPRTVLAGIPLICLDAAGMAAALRDDANERKRDVPPRLISAANGNVVAQCGRDKDLHEAMIGMDAVSADGMSLVYASKFLGENRLPSRVATTDFVHDAAKVAVEKGLSFYLFGATESENKRAVANLKKRYPDLRIAGHHHGYVSEDEEETLIQEIVDSGTDILWVGMSVPKAELFMARNREKLTGVLWVHSCGGLFNFLSGKNSRAPLWMQNIGLEWVYRAALEPARLGPRYIRTNIEAIYRLMVPPTGALPRG